MESYTIIFTKILTNYPYRNLIWRIFASFKIFNGYVTAVDIGIF